MVQSTLGLSPGVIVGGVILFLALVAMLVSTAVVVWRSRPAARAASRASRRRIHRNVPRDIERSPSYCTEKSVYKHHGDTSIDSAPSSPEPSPEPETPKLSPPSPAVHARSSHSESSSVASTLNVIVTPSKPHLVKLGACGALEVRVTPPSPVLRPGGGSMGSMHFGGVPSGPPGENDSFWWMI